MSDSRPRKLMTLVFCLVDNRVLLGMKKRGFGAGRWNGFGGKAHDDETVEDAARREVQEEAGIEIAEMEKRGVLEFEFAGDPQIFEVHVFKGHDFRGKPAETEEMSPQWFPTDEIPYHEMWPDDIHWFPLFLADKNFLGRFRFLDQDTILDFNITEVQSLT